MVACLLDTSLEDQLHGPVKRILNGHQHLGHAQADGGMTVMAAGMHKALVDGAEALAGRPVGFVLFLKYAQCVDVETHGYCGALSAAVSYTHLVSDSKAYMSQFYPEIKREIIKSWDRLFDARVDMGNPDCYGNIWEIKKEWITDVLR